MRMVLILHLFRKINLIVLVTTVWVIRLDLSKAAEGTTPVKIITGVYWKQMPETIIYEASIPLTYSAPWTHIKDGFPENKLVKLVCEKVNTEACSRVNSIAQVGAGLTAAIQQLSDAAKTHSVAQDVKIRQKRDLGLSFVADFGSWCCSIATRTQVNELYTTEKNLKDVVT